MTFKSAELSSTTTIGSGFSEVYTTEQYAVGSKRVQSADEVQAYGSGVTVATTPTADQKLMLAGERTWVFIKSSGTIAAGDLVQRTADTDAYTGVQSALSERSRFHFLGVADHAIASGSYGWVICSGACVVQANTAVDAGEAISSDGNTVAGEVSILGGSGAGAGAAIDTADDLGTAMLGIALESEGSSATYGAGYVIARIDIPA
jgi:hypothetical protein